MDENGSPLAATIDVGGKGYEAPNGELKIEKISGARPALTVRYGNLEKSPEVDLSIQSEYNVIFDRTSPVLSDISPVFPAGTDKLRLLFRILDYGKYASGVEAGNMTFTYHYDAGFSQSIRPYVIGPSEYGVDIPMSTDARILFFSIEASDAEGNRAYFEGQLPLKKASVETEANGTVEETGKEEEQTAIEGLSVPVIAGIALLAVVIYLIYRFKLREGGESG